MKQLSPHLQEVIENICCKGCAEVHGIIAEIESGVLRKELGGISSTERHEVLNELKDIMTVYQQCRN